MATKYNNSKKPNDVIGEAKKRFDQAVEAESKIRPAALDDLKFRIGRQWPDDIKNSRDFDKRPCLTINRLPQQIRQVTNDQRQNRPSIRVSPIDGRATAETAKILQGLIRHIEYNSNADAAYDTAFEAAVTIGFGYFRIITDYVSPTSFDQEILIKRIKNAFSVYVDPSYQEPDGSDMNWAFIVEEMSKEAYQSKYKDSELAKMDDWVSIGDKRPDWSTEDTCRVAEYFCKHYEDSTLHLLTDGSVLHQKEFDEAKASGLVSDADVIETRKTTLPTIKWYKINGIEVLEESEWVGQWIPIIPVLGDEINIEGEKVLEGIVRHAKDPQRMYNYWASAETETIALAPKAPFIGAEGQFEGHEMAWKTSNIKNHAYLEYNPKTLGGQLMPAPQRNVIEPPVMAITNARMQSSEDIKATTGVYDAALGNRSNESSGIAIQRRSQQSQTSNFHLIDNLTRSLKHAGRIIVDLIPKIYDVPRTTRIIGVDGEEQIVRVNEIFEENGKSKAYDLSLGKYDVAIDTGPSFASKRQEAVESMLALTKSYPRVAEIAGDLMVKNMDWNGAKEIAERLKKTLPPGLAEPEEGEKPPIPQEIQMQMQQMSQLIEGLTKKLNEAQDKLDNDILKLESNERIAFAKIEADLKMQLLKVEGQNFSRESIALLNQEILEINQRMTLLKVNEPINKPDAGAQGAMGPQEYNPNSSGAQDAGEQQEF